jgi:hypothetical protein
VAVVLALIVGAADAAIPPFQTPSHKIACRYFQSGGPGEWLRCDAYFLNDVAFRLDRRHRGRRIHVTDAIGDPGAYVVGYGHRVSVGPFTCTSHRTGLTCRSRSSRHGFTLSRDRQRVF